MVMTMYIAIPAKPTLTPTDLAEYLGQSRQLRRYHQRRHGFPRPIVRGHYKTSEIVAYLRQRGETVEVV